MELEASIPSVCRRCGDFVAKLERVCKSCRKSERSDALADLGLLGQLRRWRRDSPYRSALFFLLFIPTEAFGIVRVISRLDDMTVLALGDAFIQFVLATVLAFLTALTPLVVFDASLAILSHLVWAFRKVFRKAPPRRRAIAVELLAASEAS